MDKEIKILYDFLEKNIKKNPCELYIIKQEITDNIYNLDLGKNKYNKILERIQSLNFWNKKYCEKVTTYTDKNKILIINQEKDDKKVYLSSRLTYKNKNNSIYHKKILKHNFIKELNLIYLQPSYEKIEGEIGINFPVKIRYLAENIEERQIFYIGNKSEEFAFVFAIRTENDKKSHHLRLYLNKIGDKFYSLISTIL